MKLNIDFYQKKYLDSTKKLRELESTVKKIVLQNEDLKKEVENCKGN